MCLIVFAWKVHPDYDLILAANRDEFFDRPALAAGFHHENPDVLAGKDLREGGTWMGVSRSGRFSAITNYRDLRSFKKDAPSRGRLPLEYLSGLEGPEPYLRKIDDHARAYNGFNLLVGNSGSLWYYSSETETPVKLEPGIYGLSNHMLNTPWFKVERTKKVFTGIIRNTHPDDDELFAMLVNTTEAPVSHLPDTGLDKAVEKKVSAAFITMERYGTRCSTILKTGRNGLIDFRERQFGTESRMPESEKHFRFRIDDSRAEVRSFS